MESNPPEISKQISDKVSSVLNTLSEIVLLIKISSISQKILIKRTPIIILKIDFKSTFFIPKNQILANPTQSPLKKCIGISKYQIDEYQ